MNKPSKHLTWHELACKDGTPYPEKWRKDRGLVLAAMFEYVRKLSGDHPIIVLSAYRTPEHNRKIGGARHSQHLIGNALDLKHTVLDNETFYNLIASSIQGLPIKGLGKYRTFVHIDIRPSDRVVKWNGSGVKDSNNG